MPGGGSEETGALLAQAVRLHQARRLAEAVVCYEQALSLNPNIPEALSNLGLALKDLGRLDAAVARYEQALALRPNVPEILSNLGIALRELGRSDAAIACYRQALALKPNYPAALSNLGNALRDQGRVDEAIECYQQALLLRPDYPEALSNLGATFQDSSRRDEAIDYYRQALAVTPDFPEVLVNFGNVLKEQGKVDEAIAYYERAIRVKPGYADAYSNKLLTLHYSERHIAGNTLAEAQRFAHQVAPTKARTDFANTADPDRRLRVGYVSADFRTHPVGLFLEGVLANQNTNNIEVFCYSNTRTSDDVTKRLREAAGHWRTIVRMADADADALIRRDAIDILVDLSGHTAGNRLSLFALKPAPVQATWLGYLDTSGLPAMDYFLTDRFVVPVEDEASFTETVLRLPDAHFCFLAAAHDVPIVSRPEVEPLILGSFNNWAKVSDGTIALWSRLLAEIPESRLLLRYNGLGDPAIRGEAIRRFAVQGIDADRFVLESGASRGEVLAAYNRVDIALDPFPYNGCTTTLEALWMGVPVVTLRGKRSVARASEAILTVVGLSNLVAEDSDAYVRIVKGLASDRKHLTKLRGDLRAMVEQSPICDCGRFARMLEGLYREMWQAWCCRQSAKT
jgi:protein O-GlcNAc transferase